MPPLLRSPTLAWMTDQDPDERFAIEGDQEDALRKVMQAPGGPDKATALERLRTAPVSELELPGVRDGMIEAARRAGASWDEINAAADEPR
jgi:hypothetical protein